MGCPFFHCLSARRSDRVALALWVAASSAFAGVPDYDAFSRPDGEIATREQEVAAWEMLRDPERLEAAYADAVKGMPRAVHVVQQLEATLSASGREVAERTSRPGCLVPGYKEFSGTCRPDWSFLDLLSKDQPGGARLREVIFGAFAARARERGIENEAILSAVNGLLSLEFARGLLLEAKAGARVPEVPRPTGVPAPAVAKAGPKLPGSGKWRPTNFKSDEFDIHFNKHAGEWGIGNIAKDAYLKRAQELLGREPGGEILGHTRSNGDILRYNTRTNELAIGAQDGTIRTLFRPKDGLNYWNKQVGL